MTRRTVRGQHENRDGSVTPHRAGVQLRDPVAEVGRERAEVGAAVVGAGDLDVVAADPPGQHHRRPSSST